jgi:hypothetical protein
MRVEVMKVAQQPAMAYDKISLNTAARSGKSGLLVKSLYAFLRQLWPCWERADAFSGRATCPAIFSVGADWTAYLFVVEPISLPVPVSSGYRVQF